MFNKKMFQGASIREGMNELTLQKGEAGMLCTIINTANVGDQQMAPTTQGHRGSGLGELVRQVRGDEQRSQRP